MKSANISKQRIMAEAKKLKQEKLPYLNAGPLEDDLYTWHFTFQGPENTDFHEGIYHGQILLPYEYPFKPPDIVFMNKNGRFETNTKICLTITQYHPEEWNSAWTVRTMLEAIISLFTENVQGLGALTSTSDVRQFLAKNSHSYSCQKCGPIKEILAPRLPAHLKPPQAAKVEAPPMNSAAEQIKVQRKLSEDKKPVSEPLEFSRKFSQDQRKLTFQRNRHHQQPSLIRQTNSIPYIAERPIEEQQIDATRRSPEIIYIKDRHSIPSEYFLLSNSVKNIQSNLSKLQKVTSSIRWVD